MKKCEPLIQFRGTNQQSIQFQTFSSAKKMFFSLQI